MPADFPTRLDLFALARDYVLARATKIDPQQIDVAGSDVNIVVTTGSFMAYAVVLQLIERVNALLLDGASGEDLDRYGIDRYQLPRKGAQAAVVPVQMSRLSAAVGAGNVPVGTRLSTLTGVEYITTTSAVFGATDLSAECDARAVTAGKATQVGANTIRRFAQANLLFDPSLTVNNSEAASGGEDAEEDEVYRERIRDSFNTARRGTLAAIEQGAKTVGGVVSAQAIEALTSEAQPARVVQLYAADGSGVSNAALAYAVRVALDEWRAAGIAVLVSAGLPQIVDVQLALTFRAGVDTATLTESIRGAVVEFINSLGVNDTLYKADILAVLRRFSNDGYIPKDGSVVTPTGDIVPDNGRTLRTSLAHITVV